MIGSLITEHHIAMWYLCTYKIKLNFNRWCYLISCFRTDIALGKYFPFLNLIVSISRQKMAPLLIFRRRRRRARAHYGIDFRFFFSPAFLPVDVVSHVVSLTVASQCEIKQETHSRRERRKVSGGRVVTDWDSQFLFSSYIRRNGFPINYLVFMSF